MDDYAKRHPFSPQGGFPMATYRLRKGRDGTYSLVGTFSLGGVVQHRVTRQKLRRSELEQAAVIVADEIRTARKAHRALRDGGGVTGRTG